MLAHAPPPAWHPEQRPTTAEPHRDGCKPRIGPRSADDRLQLGTYETGAQQAYPTDNIATHSTGGDHAALGRTEGRTPTNRKAITPVGIGQRIGRFDDSGQTTTLRDGSATLLSIPFRPKDLASP
jgi:hypothetical protein